MGAGSLKRSVHQYKGLKPHKNYDGRIERPVDQNQPNLARSLHILKEATSEFVDYKWQERGKELGSLSVTLAEPNALVRNILDLEQGSKIKREGWTRFEAGLLDQLEDTRHLPYKNVPIDSDYPFELYGLDEDQLALSLDPNDIRMQQERDKIDEYFKEHYILPGSREITDGVIEKKMRLFEPHITLGRVNYDALSDDEANDLQTSPAEFIYDKIDDYLENADKRMPKEYTLPESIALRGLSIYSKRSNQSQKLLAS